jgi:DNA mismatch repair protein MSH5
MPPCGLRTDNSQVNFEESMTSNRTVVNSNVDDELDAMKMEWDGLSDLLDRVRIAMEPRVPWSIEYTLNVLYFPQIGFLIAVGRANGTESESEQTEPLDGWERIFATGYPTCYQLFPI